MQTACVNVHCNAVRCPAAALTRWLGSAMYNPVATATGAQSSCNRTGEVKGCAAGDQHGARMSSVARWLLLYQAAFQSAAAHRRPRERPPLAPRGTRGRAASQAGSKPCLKMLAQRSSHSSCGARCAGGFPGCTPPAAARGAGAAVGAGAEAAAGVALDGSASTTEPPTIRSPRSPRTSLASEPTAGCAPNALKYAGPNCAVGSGPCSWM